MDLPTLRAEWEAQHRASNESGKPFQAGDNVHFAGMEHDVTMTSSTSDSDSLANAEVDVVGDVDAADPAAAAAAASRRFNRSLLKLDIFEHGADADAAADGADVDDDDDDDESGAGVAAASLVIRNFPPELFGAKIRPETAAAAAAGDSTGGGGVEGVAGARVKNHSFSIDSLLASNCRS